MVESLHAEDPRAIGGYVLLGRLGAGGMGRVYLARTPGGRALALKTILAERTGDPGFRLRFEREIRNADRVRSPWTVPVVDWSRGDGQQWLATEYVPAPSLEEWVLHAGPLAPEAVTELAAELIAALAAVHAEGLVHRDLKPSNVLLGPQRPQLIDFGIARALDDSPVTHTGGMIGSPGYLAPEQVAGARELSPAADVFALGALLVFAATGHGPFQHTGESPATATLLYRVIHEPPVLTGLPEVLRPLVEPLLAKEPGARPAASALAAGRTAGGGRWVRALPETLREDHRRRAEELPARLNQSGGAAPARPGAQPAVPSASTPRPPAHPPTAAPTAAAAGPPSPPPPTQPHAAVPHTGNPYAPGGPATPPPPVGGGFGAAGTPATPYPPVSPYPVPRRSSRTVPAVVGAVLATALVLVGGWVLLDNRGENTGGTAGDEGEKEAHKEDGANEENGADEKNEEKEQEQDPEALPEQYIGTWEGSAEVPDRSDIDGEVTVTLTLDPGGLDEHVGTLVTNATEVLTGWNLGCTETVKLIEIDDGSIRLEGTSSRNTDQENPFVTGCQTGNVHEITLDEDDPDTVLGTTVYPKSEDPPIPLHRTGD